MLFIIYSTSYETVQREKEKSKLIICNITVRLNGIFVVCIRVCVSVRETIIHPMIGFSLRSSND